MPQLGIYTERELKGARDLVKDLIRVVRSSRLYASDHPALEQMTAAFRRRWEEATQGGPLALHFTDRKVLLEDETVYQVPGNTREVIPSALHDHGVVGFILQPGLEEDETRRLLAALGTDPGGTADYPSLLWEADLPHVQVLVDLDDADEDPVSTPAEFADQVARLGDDGDPAQGADRADERDATPTLAAADLALTEEEHDHLRRLVADDRYIETVRHALRVVHAMTREPLGPDEAALIERVLGELVGAVLAAGDLPAAIEVATRARALAASPAPAEMRAGELTLTLLRAPANLRGFLHALDEHEQLDARALGELLVQLDAASAPTVAEWLLETRFPAAVQDAMRVYREAAAEALVPLYASGGAAGRERAGGALLELGTPEALTTLAAGFDELPEETRLRLLHLASRSRDTALRRVLLHALDDPSEAVRRTALGALKRQDAPRLATVVGDLLERGALETRYRTELEDFFEMLARVGDAAVARLLAERCLPRGFRLGLGRLTDLQQLCARALRRMRAPDARPIVEELRRRAPRAVRAILDDTQGS
jgi:hypothetical protein